MVTSTSTARSWLIVTHSFQAVLLQVETLYSDLRITFAAILSSCKPMGIEKIFFFSPPKRTGKFMPRFSSVSTLIRHRGVESQNLAGRHNHRIRTNLTTMSFQDYTLCTRPSEITGVSTTYTNIATSTEALPEVLDSEPT